MHGDNGLGVREEAIHGVRSLHRAHGEIAAHAQQADVGLVEVVDQLHVAMEGGVTREVDGVVVGGHQNEAVRLSADVGTVLRSHARGVLLPVTTTTNPNSMDKGDLEATRHGHEGTLIHLSHAVYA